MAPCNDTCFSHTDSALNPFQGYDVFAKVEEEEDDNAAPDKYVKNYVDDFFNSRKQEIPLPKEPVSLTRVDQPPQCCTTKFNVICV